MLLIKAGFWFALAALFAAMEIESEGKYGWAEKAPTWYRTTGFTGKLWGFFMAGKPLTGYHLFTFLMSFAILHIPFFRGMKWSGSAELTTIALWFAWSSVWDFLWFVLNPHYGVRNFKKTNVWWHAKSHWILGLFPADYAFGWGLSLLLAWTASWFGNDFSIFTAHLWLLSLFLIFTFITICIIAPRYKLWYKMMRKRDDRDKAGIFHRLE